MLVGWHRRELGLFRPWRLVTWLLAVLALCKPKYLERSGELDLWVLLDCSDSASSEVANGREEWLDLISKATDRLPGDRLHLVEFAGNIRVSDRDDPGQFEGTTGETLLRSAIEHALSLVDPRRQSRLLVLTEEYPDGKPFRC